MTFAKENKSHVSANYDKYYRISSQIRYILSSHVIMGTRWTSRNHFNIVNQCIYISLWILVTTGKDLLAEQAGGQQHSNEKPGDTETELLDKEYGVRYPNACEACKFLTIELEDRFHKLGQTSRVIESGYHLDGPKKKTKYTRSELYFIEALENVCDTMLEYNIHKERNDSNRFDKSISTTFDTLNKLVDKGVKVDLGIPHDLWDSPSAEITALKQQCEDYLEKYDDIIEQWYWGSREQKLQQYLCRDRVLNKDQQSCLDDPPVKKAPQIGQETKRDEL